MPAGGEAYHSLVYTYQRSSRPTCTRLCAETCVRSSPAVTREDPPARRRFPPIARSDEEGFLFAGEAYHSLVYTYQRSTRPTCPRLCAETCVRSSPVVCQAP